MSLTGHLDVFPLEEVLRLLARSYKSGCLRVDSPDLHGRIYLNNGSLALATVGSDEDLRRQLTHSKLVGEEALRSAEIGGKSLNEVTSDSSANQAVNDFFREEVVESLFRIRKPGRGQSVFNVDVAPRYRADTSFDVELCVAEADRRASEWADIESVIASIDQPLRISAEAPNGEPVTLAPNTWRLVAGFEGPGSVRSLADRLGLSRFRVAKDLTALVRNGLVEADAPAPAEPEPIAVAAYEEVRSTPGSTGFGWREHVEASPAQTMYQPEPTRDEPQRPEYAQPEYATFDQGPAPAESVYHASPPSEPALESVGQAWAPTDPQWAEPQKAEPQKGDHPDSYNQGWWTEPVDAGVPGESPADPDTDKSTEPSDTFLDRVFSQLDENPEGQGTPQSPTHGFLKRRRMSSIGIDE